MNILQIANKATYPPDGGSIAILSLTKGYIKNGHRVHLLNMVTHKHYNKKNIFEDYYNNNLEITGIKINTKINIFIIILNLLFSKLPLSATRFNSKKFKFELTKIIKNNSFDLIQIEGLYTLQYIHHIRKIFKGKIIYRAHNIEHVIWKRNYDETKSVLKKIYLRILSNRIKKLELNLLNTYDYLLPITHEDADIFNKQGNTKPYLVSPFGLETDSFKSIYNSNINRNKQTINYIGALDWIPNQQGLLWFIEYCLPEIIKNIHNIQLNIAGRNAPKWLINKFEHPNVNFVGEIEDAYEFLQNPGPVIVPLFSGSGMRVKIIESMALKKSVIATNIAVEGIHCTHNKNIIIANNKSDYVNSVLNIINNTEKQSEIGENAFKFVEENYNFEQIASNILNFIQ